jgi:hypothetical protein
MITWIPAEYAKYNKVIKLKQPDGTWEDGWKVIEIGSAQDQTILEKQHQEQKLWEKLVRDGMIMFE